MSKRRDPMLAHNFTVSLLPSPDSGNGAAVGTMVLTTSGIRATAGFAEVTGLEMRMQVEEYSAGGLNGTVLKFPGRVSWTSITLKRGVVARRDPLDKSDLWTWFKGYLDGKGERRDGVITLNDSAGEARRAWAFRRGLPMRWVGPSLNAGRSAVAIETLEIAHEGITDISSGTSIGGAVADVIGKIF
jgi:phage tail-like protein